MRIVNTGPPTHTVLVYSFAPYFCSTLWPFIIMDWNFALRFAWSRNNCSHMYLRLIIRFKCRFEWSISHKKCICSILAQKTVFWIHMWVRIRPKIWIQIQMDDPWIWIQIRAVSSPPGINSMLFLFLSNFWLSGYSFIIEVSLWDSKINDSYNFKNFIVD